MSTSKLIRWSGLASIVGGLLFAAYYVISLALGLTLSNLPGVAMTGGWVFWNTIYLVSVVLLLLGLVGLYARQAEAVGTLGFIGFLLTFIGLALMESEPIIGGFVMPMMAKEAPALLEGWLGPETPSSFMALLLVYMVAWTLGSVLFGIATMRARVLPRWGALLLIVGAVLVWSFFVSEAIGHISVALVGVALLWLGYGVWSGAGQTAG